MTTPSAESASTSPGGSPGVQILTAEKVTVPIVMASAEAATGTPAAASQDVLRLRADFMAGKDLSKEDMATMLRSTESGGGGGGNGNCNIC